MTPLQFDRRNPGSDPQTQSCRFAGDLTDSLRKEKPVTAKEKAPAA